MPHRDPETGLFVADDDVQAGYDDVEIITGRAQIRGVETASEPSFDSVVLLDLDEIVDRRREEAEMIGGYHRLSAQYSGSADARKQTAVHAGAKVGTSPNGFEGPGTLRDFSQDGISVQKDDTMDAIGPVLTAQSQVPSRGTGSPDQITGGSGANDVKWSMTSDITVADPRFHARDEIVAILSVAVTGDTSETNTEFGSTGLATLEFQYIFGMHDET